MATSTHSITLLRRPIPGCAPHDLSHCALPPKNGGGERDRTDDLLLAKQALSQLSYTPIMVGLRRVELLTSPLSGVRSNQLSYRPVVGFSLR
uniref:Uncharacterized protein n=1 Tax=uncultured Rhodospirillales bacterium HF0500_23A22 TaxID=723611 RepID=E7C5I0_9PROT|nr:hypothetical protein [uncultured Rhodospirillales bacterium HF0500_23A22]